jgi:acylphosphatase
VQGVGFRYTARQIAERFAVAGFVKNLADGRVQLVVEGRPAAVDGFVDAVSREMDRYIDNIDASSMSARGEFSQFDVRR